MPATPLDRYIYNLGANYRRFCCTFQGRTARARERWRMQHCREFPMQRLEEASILCTYGSVRKCAKKGFAWVIAKYHYRTVPTFTIWKWFTARKYYM